MKPTDIREGACSRTLRYMDSYLANELLVETNHEVLRHLETCPACSAELELRTRLRSRLRDAVRAQAAPAELQVRIRRQLDQAASRPSFGLGWMRYAAVAAACLAIGAGVVLVNRPERLPDLADRGGQSAYIERVSQSVAAMLRVGLGDHLHCSVFRRYPKNPPALAEMEQELGESYKGLLPVVAKSVPAEYRVIMAHQCGYAGRRYVHLTLQNGQHLLSVVITRKQPGESLAGLAASEAPGGVPLYQGQAHHYEVASFETPEYLAFVVSDLPGQTNLQIAGLLAPAVHEFLVKAA